MSNDEISRLADYVAHAPEAEPLREAVRSITTRITECLQEMGVLPPVIEAEWREKVKRPALPVGDRP